MAVELERIGWEDGTLVSNAKVNVQGTIYEVEPEQYSGSTPLSAENLKAMEDNTENAINKLSPEAIFCGVANDINITQSYTDVATWTELKKVGNELTISDGKIKIGKGIHHIKITAKMSVFTDNAGGTLLYSFLRKNDANIGGAWSTNWIEQGQSEIIYNQAIEEVQENDKITLNHYGNGTLQALTSIIVEKID